METEEVGMAVATAERRGVVETEAEPEEVMEAAETVEDGGSVGGGGDGDGGKGGGGRGEGERGGEGDGGGDGACVKDGGGGDGGIDGGNTYRARLYACPFNVMSVSGTPFNKLWSMRGVSADASVRFAGST